MAYADINIQDYYKRLPKKYRNFFADFASPVQQQLDIQHGYLALTVSELDEPLNELKNDEREAKERQSWIGTYVYDESGINVTETRSFVSSYCIDVIEENQKLLAHKYEFQRGSYPYHLEFWNVTLDGNKIFFSYQKTCDLDNIQKCRLEYKPGATLLSLEKVKTGKEVTYKPNWIQLQPFKYEENFEDLSFHKEEIICKEMIW